MTGQYSLNKIAITSKNPNIRIREWTNTTLQVCALYY